MARTERMAEMYRSGLTLQAIGDEYSLTRERVRQLIAFVGLNGKKGGTHVKASERQIAKRASRDTRYIKRYGCSFAQWQTIEDGGRGYDCQRRNSRYRGIEWKINRWQWWTLWQESGKWDLRGRGKGKYCMARHNDTGAYEVGNVSIVPNEKNCSDARRNPNRRPRRKRADMTGIYRLYPNYKNPYVVKHGSSYVGNAATYKEALAMKRAHLVSLRAA